MPQTFDLIDLPTDSHTYDVESRAAHFAGRPARHLTLTDRTRLGQFGVDHADEPTFLVLPIQFQNGVIEAEMLGNLRPDAPDFARGFIGIAYRINADQSEYESVYLRPTNGRKMAPPPPRDQRAVQYYAYPDWKFDRLRQVDPDGPYEAGADIAPDEWMTLRIEVQDRRLAAFVNGVQVLQIDQTKVAPTPGAVGLWVDIGTDGYFSRLTVTPE